MHLSDEKIEIIMKDLNNLNKISQDIRDHQTQFSQVVRQQLYYLDQRITELERTQVIEVRNLN